MQIIATICYIPFLVIRLAKINIKNLSGGQDGGTKVLLDIEV